MDTMRELNESAEVINEKLFQFLQSTNLDMDQAIFREILALLRAGVCPDALFISLSNICPHTKIGKKLENWKKKTPKAVKTIETST